MNLNIGHTFARKLKRNMIRAQRNRERDAAEGRLPTTPTSVRIKRAPYDSDAYMARVGAYYAAQRAAKRNERNERKGRG